jgi:hypothetical protein
VGHTSRQYFFARYCRVRAFYGINRNHVRSIAPMNERGLRGGVSKYDGEGGREQRSSTKGYGNT